MTRAAAAQAMTERELSDAIVSMVRLLGGKVYRTWSSQHSPAGYPDLCIVFEGRVIWAELKRERGKLTEAQEDWILALDGAGGEVHVWRPSHWLSGEIERVIRGDDH